jgi:hypothetical protein
VLCIQLTDFPTVLNKGLPGLTDSYRQTVRILSNRYDAILSP